MKKWTILTFMLIVTCSLWANHIKDNQDRKFELLRQLSRTAQGDTTRLSIYYQLTQNAQNAQVKSYYVNKMLQEAQDLDCKTYICRSYLTFINMAYNRYDAKEVNRWMEKLEPLARKEQLYDFLFLGKRCVIDMMIINGEYELEEKEANKMLQEAQTLQNTIGIIAAYQCLANVYRMTYRNIEAAQVLEKAYKVAYLKEDYFSIELSHSLIKVYETLGDTQNNLKWITNLDRYLQRKVKDDPKSEADLQGWMMITAISYIKYYTKVNDLAHAAHYMNVSEKYHIDELETLRSLYHQARQDYFYQAGQLENALEESDHIAEIFKELSPLTYSSILFGKAQILNQLGRVDDGLNVYKQAFQLSDSINIVFLNRQSEQLKNDYDTESLVLEKKNIQNNIQLLLLGLVIVAIITLIFFVIHTFHVRNELKRSEGEMRRMANETDAANVAKQKFLSTISTVISDPLNKVVEGSLQLANDEVTDQGKRQEISGTINTTSASLMKLINNILDLSRLEAGMMKLKESEEDILSFVKGTTFLANRHIELTMPDTNKPLLVKIDSNKLQDLFKNLFDQAAGDLLLVVTTEKEPKQIRFRCTGTALATVQNQSQEVIIANEINRLLIECFGGIYQVDTTTTSVEFTLPLL